MKTAALEHIYIHVPFCLRKCGYCSFYSDVFDEAKKQKYLHFLQEEIELWQQSYILKPKTLYFGGGTPSLLSAEEIDSIINRFDSSQIEEITLEVNPVTITEKYTEEISKTKINRISLGVQSFKDDELKLLGRLHDAHQAENAYRILRRNGFENISFDLIFGLPNQKKEDLLFTLGKFIDLQPEHISTYCLSLEENVPLYPLKSQIPADEIVSDFYSLIRKKLLEAGYRQYEISNFAKPGFESKHNLCYWNDKSYLGLGPAAAGYLISCHPERSRRTKKNNELIRYTNPANLKEYFQQIETKKISQNQEELSCEDHEKEFIFLALRKSEGMDLNKFRNTFQIDFPEKYKIVIEKFSKEKLLETEGDFVRLSSAAYFVSNEIFAEFM
ncbi:MAG: radical SAM family heme chaperone HemW [Candidatus Cloacimonadales bacterium]|nr:radical SAM family heme chaperone HemW [Candidatus Cloacimonadales bacterium]